MKSISNRYFIIIIIAYLIVLAQIDMKPARAKKLSTIQDSVKASIGCIILQGQDKRLAKSYDRVKKGDKFQIFIKSYSSAYLYILNSSDKEQQSVLISIKLNSDSSILFPSKSSYYMFDGLQNKEKVTIILCHTPIPEKEISKYYSKIKNTQFVIAAENVSLISKIIGTLRSADDIQNMKLYIGKEFIFKEFNFDVKK